MASEYYYNAPMARPPPPSPWMPLFFIGVLGSMWALPMWLRFEPLLTHAVNQLSILVSLAVPILLLFLLQWLAAPATYAGQLQYPNSRFYSNRGYNRYHTGGGATLSFFGADPQSFGWALFLVLVLFLLVNSSAGR